MPKNDKIDLFVTHKDEYAMPRKPVLIEARPAAYLSITGQGAPGDANFSAKVGGLYAVAYTIKMTRKFGGQQDYGICKLEAQYGSEDGECFAELPKEQWCWKLFIRTPDFVSRDELAKAVAVLLKKGKPPEVKEVKLERMAEGPCVQMLHVGPYDREGETYAKMQAFAEGKGLSLHGLPHDIYLSDPRRVAPEKLKTILRRPVKQG